MPWREIILRVDADELPKAEALLALAGVEALSLHGDDETALLEPEPGTTPMWGRVALHALFDSDADVEAVAGALRSALGGRGRILTSTVSDEAWRAALESAFEPQRIGRLLLAPADRPRAEPHEPRLLLNMGLAFGTGRHPTTRLCLEWLEARLPPRARVLDYGTGSGVLALAALVLGAEQAWAVDIDPQALAAARDNARLNGLGGALWVGTPDAFDATSAARAGVDLVVANILAAPLQKLAGTFCRYVASGGNLVLSGLLETQCEEVETAYASCFGGFERSLREGWARLEATRRGDE